MNEQSGRVLYLFSDSPYSQSNRSVIAAYITLGFFLGFYSGPLSFYMVRSSFLLEVRAFITLMDSHSSRFSSFLLRQSFLIFPPFISILLVVLLLHLSVSHVEGHCATASRRRRTDFAAVVVQTVLRFPLGFDADFRHATQAVFHYRLDHVLHLQWRTFRYL